MMSTAFQTSPSPENSQQLENENKSLSVDTKQSAKAAVVEKIEFPISVEKSIQLGSNVHRHHLKFKTFHINNKEYLPGINSQFEIKPENCKKGAYKVFVNDNWYLQDLDTNECFSSISNYVACRRHMLELKDTSNSDSSGWSMVNLILSDGTRIQRHKIYRDTSNPEKKRKKTMQVELDDEKNDQPAKKQKKDDDDSIKVLAALSTKEIQQRKAQIFGNLTTMTCPCCGEREITQTNCKYAHIIARTKGGSNGRHNMVVTCHECNHPRDMNNTDCLFKIMYARPGFKRIVGNEEEGTMSRIFKIIQKSKEQKRGESSHSNTYYAKKYFGGKIIGGISYQPFFDHVSDFEHKINEKKHLEATIKEATIERDRIQQELDGLYLKKGVQQVHLSNSDYGDEEIINCEDNPEKGARVQHELNDNNK